MKTKEFRSLTFKEAWPRAKGAVKASRFVTLIFALMVGAVLLYAGWSWIVIVPVALVGGLFLHFMGVLSSIFSLVDGLLVCNACNHQRRAIDVHFLRKQNVTGTTRCGVCRHEIGKES